MVGNITSKVHNKCKVFFQIQEAIHIFVQICSVLIKIAFCPCFYRGALRLRPRFATFMGVFFPTLLEIQLVISFCCLDKWLMGELNLISYIKMYQVSLELRKLLYIKHVLKNLLMTLIAEEKSACKCSALR